jgi:hypothetical protein
MITPEGRCLIGRRLLGTDAGSNQTEQGLENRPYPGKSKGSRYRGNVLCLPPSHRLLMVRVGIPHRRGASIPNSPITPSPDNPTRSTFPLLHLRILLVVGDEGRALPRYSLSRLWPWSRFFSSARVV